MTESYKEHYSVLNKEILDLMESHCLFDDAQFFVDLTFGAGGHTIELAKRFPKSTIISFDQDPDALKNGKQKLNELGLSKRVHLIDSNFERLESILSKDFSEELEKSGVSGIVLDLGVSSHHFDEGSRGFSFRFKGPLDMRMNSRDDSITAYDVVNNYTQEELEEIIRELGEDRFYRSIVKNILEKREVAPIETTKDLEEIVFHSYPKKLRYEKRHPATKTFQALRIVVNREIEVLENVIPQALKSLKKGGVLAIISFHSLEDRVVKKLFKEASLREEEPFFDLLTKKPIYATEGELEENLRSRSAKLRLIKKVPIKKRKNKYPKD